MARKTKMPDFEQRLAELETLVDRMEQGDLSLEDSLAAYEQGVRLTRECQQVLTAAEQKVRLLSEKGDELIEQPFTTESP